jgi:hypothetical protein
LSYAVALAIKLHVKFSKEILELQVKIYAIEEMQLGTNMRGHVNIVLKPFLDFMFVFKPTKAHNVVVFMLDL